MHEQTLTCLYFDCRRVSYEAWVHGIDGEGIVGFGTQLCHHGCAHICLQIHLLHTQQSKRIWVCVCLSVYVVFPWDIKWKTEWCLEEDDWLRGRMIKSEQKIIIPEGSAMEQRDIFGKYAYINILLFCLYCFNFIYISNSKNHWHLYSLFRLLSTIIKLGFMLHFIT